MKHISPIQPLTDRISIVTDLFNPTVVYRSDDGYIPKTVLDREGKRALKFAAKILSKRRVEQQSGKLRAMIKETHK